jgi:hypothetical protein
MATALTPPWLAQSSAVLASVLVLGSPPVDAFTQDKQLESELNSSEPRALALFPAKGYKDGAAGLFREHEFFVVPGTARAWCQDRARGVLKTGCYVELHFQRRGQNVTDQRGEPCGRLARWYRSANETAYVPTAGSAPATAIANGDLETIDGDLEVRLFLRLSDMRRDDWCSANTRKR